MSDFLNYIEHSILTAAEICNHTSIYPQRETTILLTEFTCVEVTW